MGVTALHFIGVMFYFKLASSDKQHWAEESNINDNITSLNVSVNLQEILNNTNV